MRKNSSTYPVEIVSDAFGESPALANLLSGASRVFIVADMNVVQRNESLGTQIGHYVQTHGINLVGTPVVISGGEKVKSDNLQSVFKIVSALLEAKLGKNDIILAIGGGTILDITGYAAAQVRGGTRLVRMPTTPTAMLGAAFADYAAINLASVKDALRVPSVPSAIVIDPTLAKTVLDGVWRSGMGEAVRVAVGSDAALLKKLERLGADYAARREGALDGVVEAVVASRMKKSVSDIALWAAHRLESMSGYKQPYGYSVSIATLMEASVAQETNVISEAEGLRVFELLRSAGALDGLSHAQYLLQQTDSLLCGLDAWLLSSSEGVPMLTALGKSDCTLIPDREQYRAAMKRIRA